MRNLVELVRTKWKAVIKAVILFIAGVIVAPHIYDFYQDHIKQEETNSQIDSFLRNADSLAEATDYEDAIGEYKDVLKLISPLKILLNMDEPRIVLEMPMIIFRGFGIKKKT